MKPFIHMSADELTNHINQEIANGEKYPILSFDISPHQQQEFNVLVTLSGRSAEDDSPVYDVRFPNYIDETAIKHRSWREFEQDTYLSHERLTAGMANKNDVAILTVSQHSLSSTLEMCKDIAQSMSMGGRRPLQTGQLFEMAYQGPTNWDYQYTPTAPSLN